MQDSDHSVSDPYDLERFVQAQAPCYDEALAEIKNGRKRSHWMWFIFPQLEGLGYSVMSRRYAIKSAAEAKAYLAHPLLGPRLTTCSEALLSLGKKSAHQIFGSPDDMKLKSCATLFASVSPEGSVCHQLLSKYFEGESDSRTLQLLGEGS